jgi:hypothetical protein
MHRDVRSVTPVQLRPLLACEYVEIEVVEVGQVRGYSGCLFFTQLRLLIGPAPEYRRTTHECRHHSKHAIDGCQHDADLLTEF